jgi:hypothetical protein
MDSNKSTLDSLLGILGILSLVAVAYHTYKTIADKTETNVISDKALKVLQDPKQAEKLREAVDKYHDTGDWSKTELETIL